MDWVGRGGHLKAFEEVRLGKVRLRWVKQAIDFNSILWKNLMTNLRPTDVSLRRRLGPRRVSVPRGQLSPSRLHLRIFSLNNILSK